MIPGANIMKAANATLDQHIAAVQHARKVLSDAITAATAAAEARGYQGGAADAAAMDCPTVHDAKRALRLAKSARRVAETALNNAEAARQAFSGYGTHADLAWYERSKDAYEKAEAEHAALLESI